MINLRSPRRLDCGARTTTLNALWKYVSVRWLFIFLERSIYQGTQWVVFELNDDRLRAREIDPIRLFPAQAGCASCSSASATCGSNPTAITIC